MPIRSSEEVTSDYVVSTTYRKKQQSGTKWQQTGPVKRLIRTQESYSPPLGGRFVKPRAVSMALDLPAPKKRFGVGFSEASAAIDDNPARGLATLLHWSASPLRWEPINGASKHRGIPSAAGKFGAELMVLGQRDGVAGAWCHHPHDGVLTKKVGGKAIAALLGPDHLALAIVANMARFVNPYGDFSPCLAALECGLLEAQLAIICAAMGWSVRFDLLSDTGRWRSVLGLAHWSSQPLVVARIGNEGRGALDRLEICEFALREPAFEVGIVETFTRLAEFVAALEAELQDVPSTESVVALHPELPRVRPQRASSSDDLADILVRRSSGFESAPASRVLSNDDIATFLEAMLRFCTTPNSLALFKYPVVLFCSIVGSKGADGDYWIDLRDRSFRRDAQGACGTTMRHRSRMRNKPIIVVLGVDDLVEGRPNPGGFIRNHIIAGAWGQVICLAAAAARLSARPLRNYEEIFADAPFPLRFRSALQVVCGPESWANPWYPLSWR